MVQMRPHILIIDDNQEILDVVGHILRRHSFKVTTQIRLTDFIEEVLLLAPDLILTDKQLGWADGCNLCVLIKSNQQLRHIPVIIFSAYHKTEEECLFAGAGAFLPKPFDINRLVETIQNLLHGRTAPAVH